MSKSRTRRLSVAVACIACVVVLAAAVPVGADHADPPRDIRWLAAGDSYSAGFGLDGVDALASIQRRCETSERAWPRVVASTTSTPGYDLAQFRACSGAVIDDLLSDQGLGDEPWDLVTFTIGGNDAEFASALAWCIVGKPAISTWSWLDDPFALCPSDHEVREDIDEIGERLQATLGEIAQHMTYGGNVVVVGYPALFEDPDRWGAMASTLRRCRGLNEGQARLIRGWAGHLNATLGAAVDTANNESPNGVRFSFVNVNDGVGNNPGHANPDRVQQSPSLFEPSGSSDRHNLCGSDPWLSVLSGPLGLYHPNERGQQAIGELVTTALTNLDWNNLDQEPEPEPECRDEVFNRVFNEQIADDGEYVDSPSCRGGWAIGTIAKGGNGLGTVAFRFIDGDWEVAASSGSFRVYCDQARRANAPDWLLAQCLPPEDF